MGQFKSKSLLLTGCLMAVSFSIINCQKAPNRSGTKANVTAPGAETADKADKADAKQVAKDQCTPEAKGAVEVMRTLREGKSIETSSTKDKNEAEKNAIITDRVKYLDNCITLTKELEKPLY